MSIETLSRDEIDQHLSRLDKEVNEIRKAGQYTALLLSIHDLDIEEDELEKHIANLKRECDSFRGLTRADLNNMRGERIKLVRALAASTESHTALLDSKLVYESHIYQLALNLAHSLIQETTDCCTEGVLKPMNMRLQVLEEVRSAVQEGFDRKYRLHPMRYKSNSFYFLLGDEDPDADNSGRRAVAIRHDIRPNDARMIISIGAISVEPGPIVTFAESDGLSVSEVEGVTYRGALNARGQRDGMGVGVFHDGTVYEGEWGKGKRDGHGVCLHSNGDKYEGTFHNDMRECPEGTLTLANGDRYVGEFRGGVRDGMGVLDTAAGAHYEGEWLDDMREGHGHCDYPDGTHYEGKWQEDMREGPGTLTDDVGGRFEGTWKMDAKHGDGIVYFPDGVQYDGTWRHGDRCGQATAFTVHRA